MSDGRHTITRVLLIWRTPEFKAEVRARFPQNCSVEEYHGDLSKELEGLIRAVAKFYGRYTWLSPIVAVWRQFVRRLQLRADAEQLGEPGGVVIVEGELFNPDDVNSRAFFQTVRTSLCEYRPIIVLALSKDSIDDLRRTAYETGVDIVIPKVFSLEALEDEVFVRLRSNAERSKPRKAFVLAWLAGIVMPVLITSVILVVKEWGINNAVCNLNSRWSISIAPGKPGEVPGKDGPVNGSYWLKCTLEISNDGGLPVQGFDLSSNFGDYGLRTDLPRRAPQRIEAGRTQEVAFLIEVPEDSPGVFEPEDLRVKVTGPKGLWGLEPREERLPDRVVRTLRSLQRKAKRSTAPIGTVPAATNRSNPG